MADGQLSYFLAASLQCQASNVAGVNREDVAPAGAGYEPGQRGEPHSVGWTVTHPADVAQHGVRVPECQQLSILRPVPADRPNWTTPDKIGVHGMLAITGAVASPGLAGPA